jgi:siderophore synthetase component
VADDPTGARAAVLARLWGAFAREPLPGVVGRRIDRDDLVVTLAGGREIRGSAASAQPFARVDATFALAVAGEVVTDPADLATRALPSHRFVAELGNSATNLAAARAAQPAPHGGPATLGQLVDRPDSLTYLEQSIVDGHPLHPLCRTRMGLSAEENRAYGPEFRPVVTLAIVDVPPVAWLTTGTGLPPRLPMHPWQRDHILDAHPQLRPRPDTIVARPLMSLRTMAPVESPGHHLKTAVDVQMTSAVRTVSAAAVHNGPLMSALLKDLCHGTALSPLTEPAAGSVLVDGEPSRSLAIIRRCAPVLGSGEIAMPFAVLSAPSPASGRAYLTEAVAMSPDHDPVAFFTDLVALTLPPLLRLLHQGVALEAHGQNTLVVLRGGQPVRLLYRDWGGVRVSPARLATAGFEVPPLRGDIPSDDPDALRTKLAAAMLATVIAELVATIGREFAVAPATLWRGVAEVIRRTYQEIPAPGDEAAMLGATLPVKATTAMRLSPAPLEDLWTPILNPMAGL